MKILIAHNFYQRPGGEDAVCESEMRLLREAGHEVIEFMRYNDEIQEYSLIEKAISLGGLPGRVGPIGNCGTSSPVSRPTSPTFTTRFH